MGATPRFSAIIAFLHMMAEADPRFRKTLKKAMALSEKCFSVSEARNRIVHDPWFVDKSDSGVAQFMSMPRKDLHYGIRKKDFDWLKETISEIQALTGEVKKFDRLLIIVLEASRRKPL